MSPKTWMPRSRAYVRSARHSRSNRTWSSSEPPKSTQSSTQYAFCSRNASRCSSVTGACGSASRAGDPANADGDMYGEPVIPSGGPSGRTCHHRCPAAASQSTKRRACSSSTPFGSDVGCSRIPDARFSFMRLGPAPRRECHATVPLPKSTTPRIQIQAVEPIVDCGRYPVKATVGDTVSVYATVFKDGHDTLAGAVRFKGPGDRRWREAPLESLGNDRWGGTFSVDRPGRWQFAVAAWTD